MRPKQRSLGHCIDHSIDDGATTLGAALATVARTFPGAGVRADEGPKRYPPDVYGTERVKYVTTGTWLRSGRPTYQVTEGPPPDAGPCEGCRRTVRRYGPEGYPYCTECEPNS